jgi:HD-GYP domain-containing protein (c-di-GMP phosphodiesterase class II)
MLQVVLIVGGVWSALAVVTYVAVLPVLRAASNSDKWMRPPADEPSPQVPLSVGYREPPPVPGAPQRIELAYAALALDRLVIHTATLLGAEEACMLVRGKGSMANVVVVAQHGLDPDALGGGLPEGHELALKALAEGQPAAIPGGRFSRPTFEQELSMGAAAATPVSWHGSVRGALSVRARDAAPRIRRSELELMSELGALAGQALEHRRRRDVLTADTDAEVRLLLEAVRRADPYTSEHADDVVDLARWVGEQLELDRVAAYELELTAALHDVGKMRVPKDILHAPRTLTDDERSVMAIHPIWGFEIVAGVPGLEAVAPLVRAHHERWDGGGYPDGLAGERIPLASRIVSACDAIGALTTDRPYRAGTSIESAVREVARCSGTQFDPQVVGVLRSGLDYLPERELAVAAR